MLSVNISIMTLKLQRVAFMYGTLFRTTKSFQTTLRQAN